MAAAATSRVAFAAVAKPNAQKTRAPKKSMAARSGEMTGRRVGRKQQSAVMHASSSGRQSAVTVQATATADAETNGSAPLPPFLDPDFCKYAGTKRTDLKTIMIFGAGPIVIGQACEFDYSGTQACKALKEEGYRVVLINSNPATIMTDPGTADATYITPMTPALVEEIIAKEKPDAVLPTMGGQTALNLAKDLAEAGILDKYGVELIGAKLDSINMAEDRLLFKNAMTRIGLNTPKSGTAESMEDAWAIAKDIGTWPLIIRPAFTLGGTGGGIAYNEEEFEEIVKAGIFASATNQVLVEMSLLGWKEYELEVMRDHKDNCMIVCSIENVDPMGVHTGDSITIAPAQTLTDKEYQRLRDASLAIMREINVECGGSNCQFAINPKDGMLMVIEMNPRVSRSSALASKATGFPIAKIAAKLAVGYTLEVIPNDITKKTPASFEPSIDYVVTKIPRFAFEKFPGASSNLTTQMKSVGEAMAFGRTFQESFQKAWRSLETGHDGWCGCDRNMSLDDFDIESIKYDLRVPNPERMHSLYKAMKMGMTNEEINDISFFDPWFLTQLRDLISAEEYVISTPLGDLDAADWRALKQRGFSDLQLAKATGHPVMKIRQTRKALGVVPAMKRVDTCAAEFDASTPYMYSSYDGNDESEPENTKKVLILGGGPNRIGQGIEFDYCCCHASYSLREAGYDTIMLNSNPETVSTDYDTSSRLYFEPLTVEDVLNVCETERPDGIIVQFGGQTPLSIATKLDEALKELQLPCASGEGVVKIWGTQPENIDAAEDREKFEKLLKVHNIKQPPGFMARSEEEALDAASKIGYPVMVRPSFVLGGRAMEIVYDDDNMKYYIKNAVEVDPERPVLVDKYLANATEIDCDALCDKDGNVVIAGIMEHIEQAGVHSGDSACSIPTQTIPAKSLETMRQWTADLARALNVVGLINIQYAVMPDGEVYIIEANPRASRTVPFVAKAIGHPVAKYASLLMAGKTLKDIGFESEVVPTHVCVKEAVLPFDKFPGADALLGPEMRSTGEVMGIDKTFEMAYAKAQIAAGQRLPTSGNVFISMNEVNKPGSVPVAQEFIDGGFHILASAGTAKYLTEHGIECETVLKVHEGRPNIADRLRNGEVQLMFITAGNDDREQVDGRDLRRLSLAQKVPLVTTVAGGRANAKAINMMRDEPIQMDSLQSFF